ncbi:MAG: type IV pilus biogenesis/stability protein PilW [Rugosibacter sp.]
MSKLKQGLFCIGMGAALALVGCTTTTGPAAMREGAEQAVSERTPTNEFQQRAKVHTELGSLYLVDGRPAVALEEARIALAADANYAPAYNLLGLTHMSLNEPRLAEENFNKALQLAPRDPEISNNFGWFLCQTNREKQSIDYFMAAARNPLYSTPAKPYTNAGICAIRLKDDKVAENYLLEALRVSPGNTQAMYWLGELTYGQGRYQEARQWVAEIGKIQEPTAEQTWLALRVERKLGNREAEARLAADLRKRFGTSPEYRLLAQGKYE